MLIRPSVILSDAKDLMPMASGDEVLRLSADQIRATQDDKNPASRLYGEDDGRR
jgi:hypothetical protein